MLLSICIATYNRGAFIGETLNSILPQLRPDVEVVIVDGASPDDTLLVVAAYVERYPAIRYIREASNSGVDADYDKAVRYASGEHCWLFSDDDLLAPKAVDRVLDALEHGSVDLLIVDSEVRDLRLDRVLQAGRIVVKGERERRYGLENAEALLAEAGYCLSFIGGVIIRRDLWVSRNREPYFGSLFIHVGVIFQDPFIGQAKLLTEPLVRIRAGNSMWQGRGFEIWAFKWPLLIWSFGSYSDEAKRKVTPREPWRKFWWLLGFRALGAYSHVEYQTHLADRLVGHERLMPRLAAVFPGQLANLIGVIALALIGKGGGAVSYDLIMSSRFSNPASRLVASFWLGYAARHNDLAEGGQCAMPKVTTRRYNIARLKLFLRRAVGLDVR